MNNWPEVPLNDLLERSTEMVDIRPNQRYREVTIRLWGKGVVLRQEVDGQQIAAERRFCVRPSQFILSRIDARNGAFGIVPPELDGAVVTNDFPTYNICADRILPPFLDWMSHTQQFLQSCQAASEGTTNRVRLQEARFLATKVHLPTKAVQERIVSIIDELVGQLLRVRSLKDAVADERAALCRSVLFSDPVSPTTLTPMHELVTLRQPDISVLATDNYHFAGVYCFGRGVFAGEKKSGMEFAYKTLSRLRSGDFIYPKLMAWEGALGIVPDECDGLCVSPEYPVFTVNTERVLPEVLDVYFRSPSVWPMLGDISTGTNMRRRRLHPSNFLSFKMPLPPMATQQKLRAIKMDIDQASSIHSQAAKELDALLPSILDRAFRGEL